MIDSIRLFVSSTFRDMHAERDWLNRFVFPRLRQICERQGVDFVAVDLRWGITSEEAEQHLATDLCLREIERCRPFFLGLIGDRYGWVPLPQLIAAAEFERLRAILDGDDRALLDDFYLVDRSVECAVARLDWAADKLEQATPRLIKMLDQAGMTESGKSITEREIDCALSADHDLMPPRALFYLRESGIQNHPFFPSRMAPVFCEIDIGYRRRLEQLKRRLRDPGSAGQTSDYRVEYAGLRIDPLYLPTKLSASDRECLADGVIQPAEWEQLSPPLQTALEKHGSVALTGLEAWGEQVVAELGALISETLAQHNTSPILPEEDREPHERFIRERTRLVVGRSELVDRVLAFAREQDESATLVVSGPPGNGKSTFLAQCVRQCRERHRAIWVLPHFIGAAPGSTRLPGTLNALCRALKARAGSNEAIASDPLALEDQLLTLLEQAAAKQPLLLVIDAVNQLDPVDGSHELRWLPSRLPAGVRIVVSTLAGPCLQTLARRVPSQRLIDLPELASDQRRELLISVLAQRGKRLAEAHIQLLLDSSERPDAVLPLYLMVALEELSLFGDFDGLERRLRALPKRLPALFDQVLERLELDHGRNATTALLSSLATARAGLLESEIRDRLASSDLNVAPLWWSRLRLALDFYLQRVDDESQRGTTNFYHDQLRIAVFRRYLAMESAQQEPSRRCLRVHRELADYFISRARRSGSWQPTAARALGELSYHLALGNRLSALVDVLIDPAFLEAKLASHQPAELLEDIDRLLTHPQRAEAALDVDGLSWLRDGIRLAAHILSNDPGQLRSQLWARLIGCSSRLIGNLRKNLTESTGQTWLLPYASALNPAGGPLRRTLSGMNCVNGVVVSADDALALCHDADNCLWLWNLRTGTVWRRIELDRRPWMFASARHPSKPLAYVGKQAGGVFEVDMEAGLISREFATPGELESLVVTPDGAYLISAHKLGQLTRINLHAKPRNENLGVGWEDVEALASINRDRVYVGIAERVEHWDLNSVQKIETLLECASVVMELALSVDRQRLAVGLANGAIEVVETTTGLRKTLTAAGTVGNRSAVNGLAFTPNGEQLLSVGPGNEVRVWNLTAAEEPCKVLRGHSMSAYAVAAFNDGNRAASVSKDGTLRIWDLTAPPAPQTPFQHAAAVSALVANEQVAVSGGRDRQLCVWDLASGLPRRHWLAHDGENIREGWIEAVQVTGDGECIVSAASDGIHRRWELASGKRLSSRRGAWRGDQDYALSLDASLLAGRPSKGQPNQVEVRRLSTGRRLAEFRLDSTAGRLSFVPGRRELVIADLNGGFVVADFSARELLWSHTAPDGEQRNYIESMAISASGWYLVLGYKFGQVALWNLQTRARVASYTMHIDRVYGAAVSADETLACTVSWDRVLKLWQIPSGAELARFSSDDFWSVCTFAGDGRTIVAGDEKGNVHFLRLQQREPE